MPNHITNELIFRGVDAEEQAAILSRICNAAGEVDFSILVPAPLNIWQGSVGQRHEQAFKRTGLDWNTENWGTKWGAYQNRPIDRTDDTLTIVFDTAWRPPYPWLAAVFNSLKRSFEHNWLDEGVEWSVEGRFDFPELEKMMGNPWEERRASDETQKRLHVAKWGVEAFTDED